MPVANGGASGGEVSERRGLYPVLAACFSIAFGILALVGWATGSYGLTRLLSSWPSMKVNAAVSFVLLGSALLLLRPEQPGRARRGLAVALSIAVAVIGVLTLSEYTFGADLGIDELVVEDPFGARPGRMSVPTAIALVLLAASLVLLDLGPSDRRMSEIPAICAGIVGFTSIAGYLFEVPFATELGGLASVALPTGVALLVLSRGVVVVRREGWLTRTLLGPGPGSSAARQLMPVSLVILLGVGWLVLQGRDSGLYGRAFAYTLVAGLSAVLIGAAVLVTAARLNRAAAERAATERRLAETRELGDAVLGAAQDAIVSMDDAGMIVGVNPAAERMFGRPRERFVGMMLAEAIVPPSLRQQHREGLARYLETGEERVLGRRLQLTGMRADGSEFPVEVSILRVDLPGRPLFTGFIRDVTDRVEAEAEIARSHEALARAHADLAEHAAELERRVEERTRHLAEANAELEAFSYSVSHDLRAPLRAMDGFSRIALEEDLDPQERRHYLERIRAGAQRMGALIDDLLEFARIAREPIERKRLEPAAVVRDVLAELRGGNGDLPHEIVVGELPPCRADPDLLRLVFLNLLDNGIKFSRGRDDPRIEVGSDVDAEGHTAYFVRDNGVGFDMAYAEKVFGVFQRLHRQEEFEGTGVGLATVQRIVHRHGGRVWVETTPGEGARFSFTLEGGEDDAHG